LCTGLFWMCSTSQRACFLRFYRYS
jgi:hypothetical protein